MDADSIGRCSPSPTGALSAMATEVAVEVTVLWRIGVLMQRVGIDSKIPTTVPETCRALHRPIRMAVNWLWFLRIINKSGRIGGFEVFNRNISHFLLTLLD